MINLELFDILTKLPHVAGRIQKIPRVSVSATAASYFFLAEGFAYEYYQTNKNRQLVSWFWIKPGFVIPTSSYSNIVFSKDAEFLEFDYNITFRSLRESEEDRLDYAAERVVHDLQIAERISEIQDLTRFENFVKLRQWVPEVFNCLSAEMISSYLNIEVIQLRRFMLRRRVTF